MDAEQDNLVVLQEGEDQDTVTACCKGVESAKIR
jgi:hypothetical protein